MKRHGTGVGQAFIYKGDIFKQRGNKVNIFEAKLTELTPFADNPRNNEAAVDKVAKSIEQFGFNVPLIVDKDMVIIAGHTRFLATCLSET